MRAELQLFLYTLDHEAFTKEIEKRRATLESEIIDRLPISPTSVGDDCAEYSDSD
jgi:hypothetical protein